MRKMGTYSYISSLLYVLLFLLLSSHHGVFSISTFRMDESRNHNNHSNEEEQAFALPSHRQPHISKKLMSERPLSQVLEILTKNNTPTDFHQRLLDEQQQKGYNLIASRSSSFPMADVIFLVKIVTTAAIVILITDFLQSGSLLTVWKELRDIAAIYGLLRFPFVWIRSSHFLVDSLSFVKFFMKKDLIDYLKTNVWTTMKLSFTQMILAELWGQFWKITLKKMDSIFGTSSQDRKNYTGLSLVPEWLIEGYSFMASTVEKGCTKLVQKVIQKHLQASILTISSSLALTVRNIIVSSRNDE